MLNYQFGVSRVLILSFLPCIGIPDAEICFIVYVDSYFHIVFTARNIGAARQKNLKYQKIKEFGL
jgi:hypothetical protein